MRVQLPAAEIGGPGDMWDERTVPGAGGVDDELRGDRPAVAQLGAEAVVLAAHGAHVHGSMHGQAELLLVPPEVLGDGGGRRELVTVQAESLDEAPPRQVVDAVGGGEGERRPPELPGPAGPGGVVEHLVAIAEAEPLEKIGRRQCGLSAADDQHIRVRCGRCAGRGDLHVPTLSRRVEWVRWVGWGP